MTKKILIVDDIEFILEFEKNLLKDLSQELSIDIIIDSANSVKSALEQIKTTV